MTKNILIIIVSIFVLLTGIMGAGFFFLFKKVSPPDPQVELEEKKTDVADNNIARPVLALETFIVNLNDRGGKRYLRTTIVLELTSEDAIAELDKRLSQIRSIILMLIPTKNSTDIQTVEGRKSLGNEIISSLNYILKNGSVTNIFFTEFVIQ